MAYPASSEATPETHRRMSSGAHEQYLPLSLQCCFPISLICLGLRSFMRLGGFGWISIIPQICRSGRLSLYSPSLEAYTGVSAMRRGLKNGNGLLLMKDEDSHVLCLFGYYDLSFGLS